MRVREAMENKGYNDTAVVDNIIKLDEERRGTLTQLQELQNHFKYNFKRDRPSL